MRVEDFAKIQRAKVGSKRVLAYHIHNIPKLLEFFKTCNYKPSRLAKELKIHYQSCRKILIDSELWYLVSRKNGRGSGPNLKRRQPRSRDGYLYSEDLNSYKIDGKRSRRKMMHIDVMEKAIGREVTKEEVIHHIDLDKINNNITNLLLTSRKDHGLLHKQLESLAGELVRLGYIKFHKDRGYYHLFTKPVLGETNESDLSWVTGYYG